MSTHTEQRTVLVRDGLAGERVDAAMARMFGFSRTKAADLIAQGHVLASERTESTISVHPLGEGGSIGEQVSLTEVELQPRAFKLASDGRRLLSVGERAEHISLFLLGADGSLTLADRQPNGAGANWVRLLED